MEAFSDARHAWRSWVFGDLLSPSFHIKRGVFFPAGGFQGIDAALFVLAGESIAYEKATE